MRADDEVVHIPDVICHKATSFSILCSIRGRDHWVPVRQIRDDSEVIDAKLKSQGTLIVALWWAKRAGLEA